jgi:hypothetical protein
MSVSDEYAQALIDRLRAIEFKLDALDARLRLTEITIGQLGAKVDERTHALKGTAGVVAFLVSLVITAASMAWIR